MSRFTDAINTQIASEFAASQQYTAIAVHYDAGMLPQLAAHFYRQALEERNHAMMLVQYLLDTGATVRIPGVQQPENARLQTIVRRSSPPSGTGRVTVTAQISNLVQVAREENEYVGEQFLGWFLEEQREEVASMSRAALRRRTGRLGAAAPGRGLPEPGCSDRSRPVGPRASGSRRRPRARPRRRVGQRPTQAGRGTESGPLSAGGVLRPSSNHSTPVDLGKRPDDARARRPFQVERVAERRWTGQDLLRPPSRARACPTSA